MIQIIFAEIFVPQDFTIRLLLDPQTRVVENSHVCLLVNQLFIDMPKKDYALVTKAEKYFVYNGPLLPCMAVLKILYIYIVI